MKIAKRLLLVISVAILCSLVLSSCELFDKKDTVQNTADSIRIVPESSKMMAGKTIKLSLNNYDGEIVWSSSDSYIEPCRHKEG